MKKRLFMSLSFILILFVVGSGVYAFYYNKYYGDCYRNVTVIGEGKSALSDSLSDSTIIIEEQNCDRIIIPDKYNSGAKGTLDYVAPGSTYQGIYFKTKSANELYILDFVYSNRDISGLVVVSDADFSNYPFSVFNEKNVNRDITVKFINCKFSYFSNEKGTSSIDYVFENCSFYNFSGSNASFNQCLFGNSNNDGLNPFHDVAVENSFFCNQSVPEVVGYEVHTDGTQIYAYTGVDATNIHFENCRFEDPQLQIPEGSKAYFNACIMLQLEMGNGDNISFRNCYLNGGGYSIYAWQKNPNFTMDNVVFENIAIGNLRKYGQVYYRIDDCVVMDNIYDTDSLYVSSVWEDEIGTHIVVTNDTSIDRQLTVYTDKDCYSYTVPRCPSASEMLSSYEEYPFDIEIIVEGNAEWIVCFDGDQQIRYCNWSGKEICKRGDEISYLDDVIVDSDVSEVISALMVGKCGDEIDFVLSEEGVLKIEGSGDMYHYNSFFPAPWLDFANQIQEILFDGEITSIGSQAFRNCKSVRTINIPVGVTTISKNAFISCTSLTEVSIPYTISVIEDMAFWGCPINDITYGGDDDNFLSIAVVGNNDRFLSCYEAMCQEKSNSEVYQDNGFLLNGKCGNEVSFVLDDQYNLFLSGKGATYDYNSISPSPWYEYASMIKYVSIDSGITVLGEQLFRNLSAISEISIPDSVGVIGKNVFISCANLTRVNVESSSLHIMSMAFFGCPINEVVFQGDFVSLENYIIEQGNAEFETCFNLLFEGSNKEPEIETLETEENGIHEIGLEEVNLELGNEDVNEISEMESVIEMIVGGEETEPSIEEANNINSSEIVD